MLKKFKRFLTCWMPVAPNRRGQCIACGACCKLPNVCPFLRYDENGRSLCAIYRFRPPNCRKYPRTEAESLTADTCGFWFDHTAEGESASAGAVEDEPRSG